MQVCSIITLTKSKCQNMRYTNKSEAMYMSAVAAFFLLYERVGCVHIDENRYSNCTSARSVDSCCLYEIDKKKCRNCGHIHRPRLIA